MYSLGTLCTWLNWGLGGVGDLFRKSIGVFAGAVILWAVVGFVIVPREEHTLEAAFGQVYLQYKNRTPRWL
jgi:protein-S-isoprenylcysteine O-methyltransferase Ste14